MHGNARIFFQDSAKGRLAWAWQYANWDAHWFPPKNTEISIFATIHIKYITNSTVFYLNSTHGYLYLSPHPQRIKAFKLLLNCAQLCIKF